MSVTSLGVGSGLDLESLVRNMVSVQRDSRVASYNDKISDYKSEVSSYGAVRSAMEKFQESVSSLNDVSLFNGRTATMEQPSSGDIVSVTADSDASNGSYNISVEQLSQGSRSVSAQGLFSSASDEVSASGGELTYTAGSETFSINVAAGATLEELRNQINDASDNFGVSANLVDDGSGNVYLSLTSEVSGAGNDLVVQSGDASLDSVASVAAGGGAGGLSIAAGNEAKDAIIDVDGITIRSDSNKFDSAVSGLEIEVLAVSALDSGGNPETAKAEIGFDVDAVQETLENFVSSYNSLLSVFDKQTKAGESLNGSSMIRNIESSLNSDLMTEFTGAGTLSSIFDIGIEMDDKTGNLSLDSTKFSDAMSGSYDDVATLFSGDAGLGNIMDQYLDNFTGSGGLINTIVDSTNESVSDTEGQLENYEYRMEQYEQRLRDQFTQLDSLLASMNSNGNYLMSQLSSLSNNNG
ncbi:flagellar filament capping protein FliD [Marinomonas atlantica]|uniref:flagellar filament capping protein FliD n=1 Tax=Marinomonas atlantica TaxID=1806668 RepID=UPI000834689F|nr:flagellar filament capping protein FliD [Marinomonas atlantica]